jgi:hypothetical protein
MKLDDKPVEPKKQASGLLAPKTPSTMKSDEDLSEPVTRVKKHLQAIRERRINNNGS